MLAGLVFFWIIGQILSVTADGTWIDNENEETMRSAVSMSEVEAKENIIISYVKPTLKYLGNLPKMFAWDYSYLDDYEIIKWIVLYPISAAMVFGIVMLFAQVLRGIAIGSLGSIVRY